MSVQLFIEDKPVDLTGDETISVDYAIAEIGKIEARKGAVSVQFSLPKTVLNRRVFQNPDDVNNLSAAPYRRLKARLLVDGVDMNITMCTLEETADFYNCRLYGKETDFFNIIKSRKLSDIDLSQFDYFHTLPEVVARRQQTNVCYPVTWNLPETSTEAVGDIRWLPPGCSVEYLLERICTDNGYTLVNNIKNDYGYPARYLCLPFTRSEWVRNYKPERYYVSLTGNTTAIPASDLTGVHNAIVFNTVVNAPTNYWNGVNTWVQGIMQIVDDVTLELNTTFTVAPANGYTGNIHVAIAVNGTDYYATSYSLANGPVTVNLQQTVRLTPDVLGLSTMYIYFRHTAGPGTYAVLTGTAAFNITGAKVNETHEVARGITGFLSGQWTTPDSMLPEMSQSELLKAYCQLFCCMPVVEEKTLSLIPFKTITDNVGKVVDWSNRQDFSDTPLIKTLATPYGQASILDWKYDDADKEALGSTGFAKDVIPIEDENLPPEYNILDFAFAASEMVTKGGFEICKVTVFDEDGGTEGCLPRMVFVEPADVSFNYQYPTTQNVTTAVPLTYFNKTGGNFNLSFGHSFLQRYWLTVKNVVNKYRHVTCRVRLTAADINRLDFTRPVYLKYFNSYFYLNAVKGFNAVNPGSTTVELVKLF